MKPIVEYLINKNTKSDKLSSLDDNELWIYHQFGSIKCLEHAAKIKDLLEDISETDTLVNIKIEYLAELIMINALNMNGHNINVYDFSWLSEFDYDTDAKYNGRTFNDPPELYEYCLSNDKNFAKEVEQIINKLLEYGFDDIKKNINTIEYKNGGATGPHEYYYFLHGSGTVLERGELIDNIRNEKSLYDAFTKKYKNN